MDRLTRSLNCPALVDTSCSVLAVAASRRCCGGQREAVFFSTNRGPLAKEFTLQENGSPSVVGFRRRGEDSRVRCRCQQPCCAIIVCSSIAPP